MCGILSMVHTSIRKHYSELLFQLKVVDLFDSGSRAEMDRKNGRMYGGFPVTSYTMVFLDHLLIILQVNLISNLFVASREYLYGIYQGITSS